MKKIVISAVNFNEGGPLSVLKDCLKSFQKVYKAEDIDIIVFVHKISLVQEYVNDFQIFEYPEIKKSWLKRIRFEYFECEKISTDLAPDLWISLHDITPNVKCKQVVYCHNPSPFFKLKPGIAFTDFTFFLFCLFYRFLYRVNIKKNEFVIVQQQWLREEFERRYKIKTVVSYPKFIEVKDPQILNNPNNIARDKYTFFFPAFPRVAKNFETLLQATQILAGKRNDFELILTINGSENKYAKKLYSAYKNIEPIKFSGSKTRAEVFDIYNNTDCLVFPSKLETWGLPISEFKTFNKPMLLSDLKFAHETLGSYKLAKFFDPDDSSKLANYMSAAIDNALTFDDNRRIIPANPFFNNWDEMIGCFLTEL